MMKETKKLTVSAMAVALSVLFLLVGAAFELMDLTAAALASAVVVFIYIEIGSPYTWLCWLATSLISFLLYSGSAVWLNYFLVFGCYPIVKGYIERLPRVIWLTFKLLFVNAELVLMFLGTEYILGVPFFGDLSLFGLSPLAVRSALWLGLILAFLLYDRFITLCAGFYTVRLAPTVRKLLK